MAKTTKIQWCDSTENPTMGCDGCELWEHEDGGAKICYAGVLHQRHGGSNPGYAPTFKDVMPFGGRMARAAAWSDLHGRRRSSKPWLDGLPRLIFVSDMSDALSANVSFEFLETEIVRAVTGPKGARHQWLWLTKRPRRMAAFSRWLTKVGEAWPANLWAGTSITGAKSLQRVTDLLDVGDESTIRFLSVEPQWEAIDLKGRLGGVAWVIQGGQSGPGARPFCLEWADEMRAVCRKAGVPYFLKQIGAVPTWKGRSYPRGDSHGGDWSAWPSWLRVRQVPRLKRTTR